MNKIIEVTLVAVAWLLALVGNSEQAIRGGGGARYSSYRSSYSSYSYRSSYYSYNSYSYYSYSSNSYTYRSSRYSYNYYPSFSVRYSPVYYGGYYYYYYYYYRPSYYLSSPSDAGSGVTVCQNFVAGDPSTTNSTALGYFVCPFNNEPSDYTYCCGQSDAQYCCRFADDPGRLGGLIAGIVIGVLIIVGIIICLCCICKRRRDASAHRRGGVTTTVSTVTQSHATYTNGGNVTVIPDQTGGSQQYPQSYANDGYSSNNAAPPAYTPSAFPPPNYTTAHLYAPAGDTTQPYLPPTAPGQGTLQKSSGDNHYGNGQGQGYSAGYPPYNAPYPPAPGENGHSNPPYPTDTNGAYNKYTG